MRRFLTLLTVSGLCLSLLYTSAMAQNPPREQKMPTPATAEEIAAAKRQSKDVFGLFRDNCFVLAGDTDTIVGRVLVSGMKEAETAATLDSLKQREKEIKNYRTYGQDHQIGLRLEKKPWKCTVFGEGVLDTAIVDRANNLYRELYTDRAYSNLKAINIPDKKDFDKTHSLITADREDGAHYKFRVTYGGQAPDRTVLSLEFTPPRERASLSEYLAMNVGKEQMKLPAPKRNSKIAVTILKNACLDNFGDFKALSKWATTRLSENDEFIIDDTRGTWIAEDKDVNIMLNAESGKKTSCRISGGSVDANVLHRDLQEILTAHANEPGQSIAANQYSIIRYKDEPNDMPEGMPYFSGGILRFEKQEIGIDIVLSTKRKDDKIHFTIKAKPTTER